MITILLAAMLSGPVPCNVVRVLDGDTVEVVCQTWLGTTTQTLVRLRGVDTPEKAPYAKCPEEAALASRASKLTKDALPPGQAVRLYEIANDKYGGRVVAGVAYDLPMRSGILLADELIEAGLAREYDGGKKSSWCK